MIVLLKPHRSERTGTEQLFARLVHEIGVQSRCETVPSVLRGESQDAWRCNLSGTAGSARFVGAGKIGVPASGRA